MALRCSNLALGWIFPGLYLSGDATLLVMPFLGACADYSCVIFQGFKVGGMWIPALALLRRGQVLLGRGNWVIYDF